MLDTLKPFARHLVLVVVAALLTAVGENIDGLNLPTVWVPIVGAVVTMGLAWATPLTRQYGVGSNLDTIDVAEVGDVVADPTENL